MKGKKTDSEFVSDFICQCSSNGINTPELIVNYAKNIIAGIDEEIVKIEQKKVYRSKLLDVISSINKTEIKNKSEDAKILSFFKIKNPNIYKNICSLLKDNKINDLPKGNKLDIKQLVELKIISKRGNVILRGEKFDDYVKFNERAKCI